MVPCILGPGAHSILLGRYCIDYPSSPHVAGPCSMPSQCFTFKAFTVLQQDWERQTAPLAAADEYLDFLNVCNTVSALCR